VSGTDNNSYCGRFLGGVEMQRGEAPMTWGEIGQLMSGTGVLVTSLCAGVTVTIISLHQKRKQWVDDFRALYAEFWNDKNISQVRRWIVSNTLYNEALKPILTQRIEKGYNDLDEDGSLKIDMIDKFMSLILRLETLEESIRTKRHRALTLQRHSDTLPKFAHAKSRVYGRRRPGEVVS
jgi:hypothetical protein